MENKDQEMKQAQELSDAELENVDGGFNLVFNIRKNCPACGPRISLRGGTKDEDDDQVCPLCGRKISDSVTTDLRYNRNADDPKITRL